MELTKKLEDYNALLDRKADLAAQTKENNAAIESMKQEIEDMMIDEDITKITAAGYNFSLVNKTEYSKKSEKDLADAGLNFFEVLRNNDLGDLIKETVDRCTYSAACREMVTERGELPDEIQAVTSVYETTDISRRKAK